MIVLLFCIVVIKLLLERTKTAMDNAPKFLYIDTNLQCNLRCKTCMFWLREEVVDPSHISVERRSQIISEFAELNPNGTVVICGGESMLNPERFYPVANTCKRLGLNCLAVVNGTMITTSETAEKVINEGVTEIVVSLNSHIAEIHDYTRGVVGSFDTATNAVRLLLDARIRLNVPDIQVYVSGIVCEQNYRELDAFYNFVLNDLGADKLDIHFLQPTFGSIPAMKEDKFYKNNIINDYEELFGILNACNEKYNLQLNPEWLEVAHIYHKSVKNNADAAKGWSGNSGTQIPICKSFERNIMVDLFGVARLCFSHGFQGTKLVKHGDMKEFWYGNDTLRSRMSKCNKYCGISACAEKK